MDGVKRLRTRRLLLWLLLLGTLGISSTLPTTGSTGLIPSGTMELNCSAGAVDFLPLLFELCSSKSAYWWRETVDITLTITNTGPDPIGAGQLIFGHFVEVVRAEDLVTVFFEANPCNTIEECPSPLLEPGVRTLIGTVSWSPERPPGATDYLIQGSAVVAFPCNFTEPSCLLPNPLLSASLEITVHTSFGGSPMRARPV